MMRLTDEEAFDLLGITQLPQADEAMIMLQADVAFVGKVAKAQLEKVVGVLRDKTVKAWGGNRVILSEDWQALLKECE